MNQEIGYWDWDENGLPAYEYTGEFPFQATDKTGADSGLPEDPCFILGNSRMTLFAHVSGAIELISGQRGWERLNFGGKNQGKNQTEIAVGEPGKETERVYTLQEGRRNSIRRLRQRYGVGYAMYLYETGENIEIQKVISVQPSGKIQDGNSSFLCEVTIRNTGNKEKHIRWSDGIAVCCRMMNCQDEKEPAVRYENRLEEEESGGYAEARISAEPARLLLQPRGKEEQFPYDLYPPKMFLQVFPKKKEAFRARAKRETDGDWLTAEAEFSIRPEESRTLRYVIGFTFDDAVDAGRKLAGDMLGKAGEKPGKGAYEALWTESMPETLKREPDEILRCEMLWNLYVLKCMATYHEYFRETFIPQGSVYAYHLGQNASNRDHLQHCLGVLDTEPELAKSCIRFAMKHMLPGGEIKRQDIGFGYCDPGIYMESDPQLYLFMAAGEYLKHTGNLAFLEEQVEYYPRELKRSDSVLRFLIQSFTYLRDTVGKGRNGLIRMLNSDWSDSFFHPYSPNIYSLFAQSHMNTTMALAVIPPLTDALRAYSEQTGSGEAAELAGAMEAYRSQLKDAFRKDMEGRSFAPRCYIGEHGEAELKFGMDDLCLEPQPFLLQMEDYPQEQKRKLWQEIRVRVLDMEKIGARTREKPLWSEEGVGEDGGIWFSHQGQLLAGLASFDVQEGWKLLRRLTFHNYAKQYPDYWVGRWTMPDSLESSLSHREGLYHFWVSEAFWPFCAHIHAWMLYGYFRLQEKEEGIET